MGTFIVDRIVRAHLKTMARLNIGYDLLTYEGDILRLQFWAHAFETLKAQGAVFLQTEGKLAGCWVMRIEEEGSATASAERPAIEATEADEPEAAREGHRPLERRRHLRRQGPREPVLEVRPARPRLPLSPVRRRRPTAGRCGRRRPATNEPGAPPFGHAQRIYNVIDSRQMYLQALLSQALRTLGHPTEAENSIHFSYEMVALSHATARELGYETAAGRDAKKPFVEVSGRKGLGVKIDDLLDLLTNKATAEVAKRNPEFTPEECQRVGAQIAVARDPVLHAEVLARQADRVRHRGGAQLRG